MRASAGRRGVVLCTAVGAAILTACMTSPDPRSSPRSTSPYGQHTRLYLENGRSVAGELLAVTDTAWYLMVGGRVGSARTAAIAAMSVDLGKRGIQTVGLRDGAGLNARRTEAARDGARFPHGIPPEIMTALLARSSQSEADDLVTRPP